MILPSLFQTFLFTNPNLPQNRQSVKQKFKKIKKNTGGKMYSM
jgi:hypothetical protein